MKKLLAFPPAAFSFDAISFDDGSLAVTIVQFLAVVITGLALIAPGAHVFELLRKMAMSEKRSYVVQDIYRGWWVVGLLLPGALIANVALAVAVRAGLTARGLATAAAALLLLNLVVSAIWTRPVNFITDDWCAWSIGRRCAGNGNIPTPSMQDYANCFLCFDADRIAQTVS